MLYGKLYTRSLGVHISRDHVRAVELVRVGRWIRRGRTWCLPAEGRIDEALVQLTSKFRRTTVRVATHVEPAHVRVEIREVAVEEVGREDWKHRMVAGLLPEGVSHEGFASTYRILRVDEEHIRVGVAVIARRALNARLTQFEEAGFEPAFIGVAAIEVAGACAFDEAFNEECRKLIVEHDGAHQLVEMREGVVESLRPLSANDFEGLRKANEAIWFAPCDPPPVDLDEVTLVRPLTGLGRGESLDPAFAVAAGLAMRGLYLEPGREGDGSFLQSEEALRIHADHEEQFGKRITAALAVLVLGILLAFTAADTFFAHRLAQAEGALAPVAGLLATVEEQQSRTDRLRREMVAAEERLAARTQSAATLATAAALSPAGIRWRELGLVIDEAEEPLLILHGIARVDTSLAVFLRDLEASPLTADVRLVVAETVSPTSAAARDVPPGPPLRRFEIHARVPRAAGTAAPLPSESGLE